MKATLSTLLFCLLLVPGGPLSAQAPAPDLSLGSIDFPTSVQGEAQTEFLTGVLALHSFWYPEARDHFRKARELNPDFAMAYWGEAMTHDHPIWEQHDQQAGAAVLAALEGRQNPTWDAREKALIDAVRILYDDSRSMDERRRHYAEAMRSLEEQYPEDDEILAFTALARMSLPSFTYENPAVEDVVPIAARLEALYQRNPSHPGAMHYLIHVYDSDKFARMGLRPANDYAGIAYSSSHAIHMPSHIYRQLGMWDRVISANIDAWEASVKWQQRTGRPLHERDYHSYRWLFESYLQTEQYTEACDMLRNMHQLRDQARRNGEEAGRIPGVIENFSGQYKEAEAAGAPSCTAGNSASEG